jgi:hypothetical protein
MWVTSKQYVDGLKPFTASVFLNSFTHNLSHRLKSLNTPLTWGYSAFPQISVLVTTTTTYNYMKTPVLFPLFNYRFIQLSKIKNLQSFTTAGRLTK